MKSKTQEQEFEIRWANGERETVRAKTQDDAASKAARRKGADGARLVRGASYRYQAVTSASGGGANLGAQFTVWDK